MDLCSFYNYTKTTLLFKSVKEPLRTRVDGHTNCNSNVSASERIKRVEGGRVWCAKGEEEWREGVERTEKGEGMNEGLPGKRDPSNLL